MTPLDPALYLMLPCGREAIVRGDRRPCPCGKSPRFRLYLSHSPDGRPHYRVACPGCCGAKGPRRDRDTNQVTRSREVPAGWYDPRTQRLEIEDG